MSHRLIQHFIYPNLRAPMPEIVKGYRELAEKMNDILEPGPEKDNALRKLLESCDAALRAREFDLANKRHDEAIASMAAALYPPTNSKEPLAAGMIPAQHRRS